MKTLRCILMLGIEINNYCVCRLLLSIDRRQSLEEALDTVEMTAEYQQKGDGVVVGIDLSGDPTVCYIRMKVMNLIVS